VKMEGVPAVNFKEKTEFSPRFDGAKPPTDRCGETAECVRLTGGIPSIKRGGKGARKSQ